MDTEAVFLKLSKEHNLKYLVLYTYDLKKEKKSKAVRFVYLLKGRNGEKGVVTEFNGLFLAPGCFMIPVKHDDMRDIFTKWGIKFKRRLMLTN